jgi:hypothetical protein
MGILSKVLLVGWAVSLILLFFLFHQPKMSQCIQEKDDAVSKYLALLESKTDTIRVETIVYDTIVKDKFIPTKTFDTIYQEVGDTVYLKAEANWYFDTIRKGDLKIDYAILTFGTLQHLDFKYQYVNTTETIQHIVYRDVIKKEPAHGLYADFSVSPFLSDLRHFNLGVTYVSKSKLKFSTGHIWHGEDRFWVVGVGYRLF